MPANSPPLRIVGTSRGTIDRSLQLRGPSARLCTLRQRAGRRSHPHEEKSARNGRSFDVSRSLRYQSRCRLEWRGVSSGRDRGWRSAHTTVQGLEGRLDGRSVEWKGETGPTKGRGDLSYGETRAQGERRDENDATAATAATETAEKGVADCVAHRDSKRVSRGKVHGLVGRRDSCTMPEIPGGLRFRALFQTLRLPHGDFSTSSLRPFLLLLTLTWLFPRKYPGVRDDAVRDLETIKYHRTRFI